MTLFGKILAVLNLLALGGFVYLATQDFQMRQAWSYAVLRWEIALDGLPVDDKDTNEQGKPRAANLNEALAQELVGSPDVTTQEGYLDRRANELMARVEGTEVKGTLTEKLVLLLLPLQHTAGDREKLLALMQDRTPATADKLREQFVSTINAVKQTGGRDAKRLAIARTLVSLVDVLPTDEEQKQRNLPPAQRPDITDDVNYKRALNAVGVRMMSLALDQEAHELLGMADTVKEARQQERTLFAYEHQTLLNRLIAREQDLQEQRDLLAVKLDQAKKEEEKADLQESEVKRLDNELEKLRLVTAQKIEQLDREQEKLFAVRVRLRDANVINQRMEQQIRLLEERARGQDD